MKFHLFGILNAVLFLFTWYGLFHQFKLLEHRRRVDSTGFTGNLSAQQFLTSFSAFFAIFFLGLTEDEFNHYLVWTRLGALLLLIAILFEIHLDRKSRTSLISLGATITVLSLGCLLIFFRPLPFAINIGADILTVIITFVLAYGNIHQIRLLKQNQEAPLSKRLLGGLLIKDCSTLAFGLTMSFEAAWPLLLLNGSSFLLRSYILFILD